MANNRQIMNNYKLTLDLVYKHIFELNLTPGPDWEGKNKFCTEFIPIYSNKTLKKYESETLMNNYPNLYISREVCNCGNIPNEHIQWSQTWIV
jgi:hypothetical protein